MRPWLGQSYETAARVAEWLAAAVPRHADSKLARTFSARRGILERYREWGRVHRDPARPLLWMHAASVGEALMALPVAERVRSALPRAQIAFTFFSPSAEDMGHGTVFDFADYIPFDSRHAVRVALDVLAPSALVFTKSDVWPELVAESTRRNVRLGLISASMPEHSSRATTRGSMFTREAYGALDGVGAASEEDARALVNAGVHGDRVQVTGDTRYDQAWTRAHVSPRNQDVVNTFTTGRPTIVAGSTWRGDEAALLPAFARLREAVPATRLIIAPHEVGAARISALGAAARKSGAHVSLLGSSDVREADVIIVDRVGVLADLYALATVAYVGGGFHDAGLHSLVEPAVFRVPTIIGPLHAASRDAKLMLAAGGAIAARDADALSIAARQLLTDAGQRASMSDAMGFVVSGELGAADRSFQIVRKLLGPM